MNNYPEIIKNIYNIVAKEHNALSLATTTSLPNLPSINSLPNDFWSAQLILLKIKDRLYEIAKNENLLFNDGANAITSHLAEVNPHQLSPEAIGAVKSTGDTMTGVLNVVPPGTSSWHQVARFDSTTSNGKPYITVGNLSNGGVLIHEKDLGQMRFGTHGSNAYCLKSSDKGVQIDSSPGTTLIPNVALGIHPGDASHQGLEIVGNSGQTANLLNIKDSAGTAFATVSGNGLFKILSQPNGDSLGSAVPGLEIFQPTPQKDACITFCVSGDYACHFGLDGTTNDLFVGGWSMGAVKYRIPKEHPWQTATYGAGWADYDTTQASWWGLQYRRVGTKVEIRGLVKRTATSGSIIATLPAGYRPVKYHMFGCLQSDYKFARVDMYPDGRISFDWSPTMSVTTIPWLDLHSISFYID